MKIAGIKAGNADGFFFPEAVVCAFVWAGTHGVDVTNNSYFADPYLYNCKNDPTQRAIWKAEQRAIMFAEQQGVTVVAAEGNESEDLSHPSDHRRAPTTRLRSIAGVTNACAVVPVEVPGVIGVTATGTPRAPAPVSTRQPEVVLLDLRDQRGGRDGTGRRLGLRPHAASPNGRVLSTWPASLPTACLAHGSSSMPRGAPTAISRARRWRRRTPRASRR